MKRESKANKHTRNNVESINNAVVFEPHSETKISAKILGDYYFKIKGNEQHIIAGIITLTLYSKNTKNAIRSQLTVTIPI